MSVPCFDGQEHRANLYTEADVRFLKEQAARLKAVQSTVIPEPSSLALLAMGMLAATAPPE